MGAVKRSAGAVIGANLDPLLIVVEDNEQFGRGLGRVCAPLCQVTWVSTPSAARELLLSRVFIDAVLLDVRLGSDNGLDLLAEVRPFRPLLPVLVMTGFDDAESPMRAWANGCLFLQKTAPPNELTSLIVSFVERHTRIARTVALETRRYAEQARLTRQQASILHAYMRGVSRANLREVFGIEETTLRTHISSILGGRFACLATLAEHILAGVDQEGGPGDPMVAWRTQCDRARWGRMSS